MKMTPPSQENYLKLLRAYEKLLLEHIKGAIRDQIKTQGGFAFGYNINYRNRSNMDDLIMHSNGIESIRCTGDDHEFELQFRMKGYISESLLTYGLADDLIVTITNIFNADWYLLTSNDEVSKYINQIHLFRARSGSRKITSPRGAHEIFQYARLMQALASN
jgi:hypothetical protein